MKRRPTKTYKVTTPFGKFHASGGTRRARRNSVNTAMAKTLTPEQAKLMKSQARTKAAQNIAYSIVGMLQAAQDVNAARDILKSVYGKDASKLTTEQVLQLWEAAKRINLNSGTSQTPQLPSKPQDTSKPGSNGTSKGVYVS